ncbi:hypothetical protein Q7C36_014371 [Tachysurus vachellii]|uniref:Uncharacterized protein n=1 Tax=Tachysurus vachellii TaxID=175792 RepID=A0AA88SG56_TACVA|nr:hypothetical protein Q7C36_014371 [Tachysurus vachellii]
MNGSDEVNGNSTENTNPIQIPSGSGQDWVMQMWTVKADTPRTHREANALHALRCCSGAAELLTRAPTPITPITAKTPGHAAASASQIDADAPGDGDACQIAVSAFLRRFSSLCKPTLQATSPARSANVPKSSSWASVDS